MRQNAFRLWIVTAALALLSSGLKAAPVDVGTAQAIAMRTLENRHSGTLKSPSGAVKLVHAEPSAIQDNRMDYYVFNVEQDGGFVIVAGDDRVPGALAWGDGNLDMAHLPEGLQWLLGEYKRQMDVLLANGDARRAPSAPTLRSSSSTVEPLLTCTWSQGRPFFDQCPTYNGLFCATGCTATAMAQVMYYWKYPDELPALPSYTTDDLGFEVPPLPGTRLDWENMLDSYHYGNYYTDEQGAAVATLMRYCGQSCFMDYSPEGSGAHQMDQLAGLLNFGYSPDAVQVKREDYDAASWDEMILDDLSAGRPVSYVGFNENGGHAFVLDGHDGGKYHVNWGGGGTADGYFTLDMLGEEGWAYHYKQTMIHGVCPSDSGDSAVAYDFEADGLYYRVNGDEATVVSRDYHFGSYQGDVSIPREVVHDGKTRRVTAIGDNAFRNSTQLLAVNIPSSIKSIGKNAFRNCFSISQITIGSNITLIDEDAFYHCMSLKRVDIEDMAAYCSIDMANPSSSPLIYGASLYCDGGLVNDLVIPDGVEEIKSGAFIGCSSITGVVMNEGVKRVADYAFAHCNSLKSLTLPASLEWVDYGAFMSCVALEDIHFMGDNLPMSEFVFYNCQALKHVELPARQEELAYATFGDCTSLEHIDLGQSIKRIDSFAFYLCTSLERLHIPETVTEIGEGAFSVCTGLKAVDIDNPAAWCGISFEGEYSNPVTLAGHLSVGGQPLERLVVQDGVPAISDHAFMGCLDLTSVSLARVNSIGAQAFNGCKNLQSVAVGSEMKAIGKDAFKGCVSLKTVDAASLEGWLGIAFAGEVSNPVSQARHLSIGGEPLQQLTMPQGVTAIADYAFTGCEDLTGVTVEGEVTTVGNYAFYQCKNLQSVTAGNQVKTIGEKAFNLCTSLQRVALGNAVEHLGAKTFASCMALTDVTCRAVTPPASDGTACFASGAYKKATLRVPACSREAYREADMWSQFKVITAISDTAACDVNGDGEINLSDVNTLIDLILRGEMTLRADVNGDGELSIADVNVVISAIMQGQ